jgi:hypothetical protein
MWNIFNRLKAKGVRLKVRKRNRNLYSIALRHTPLAISRVQRKHDKNNPGRIEGTK